LPGFAKSDGVSPVPLAGRSQVEAQPAGRCGPRRARSGTAGL